MTPLEMRIISEVWTRFERSNCSCILGTAESNAVEMVRRSVPRWGSNIVSCHELLLLLLLLFCNLSSLSATSILDDGSSIDVIRPVVLISAEDNTARPKPMMRAAVYCNAKILFCFVLCFRGGGQE